MLQQSANDHADAPDSPLVTSPLAQASEEQAAPGVTVDAVSASPDVTEEAIPVSSAKATAAKEDFWSGLSTTMVQKRDVFLAPARLPPMLNATRHYAAQSARLRSHAVCKRKAGNGPGFEGSPADQERSSNGRLGSAESDKKSRVSARS